MTFVNVEVGQVSIRMRLNDEQAPKTTAAFVEALPFAGRAVHAQTSGEMFRMLDDVPIDVAEIEAKVQYQAPGTVVFLPEINEIAFAYGSARFSGAAGPSTLTHIGDLEGNLDALAQEVGQIRQTGFKPIKFSLADDQTSPFIGPSFPGRKVEVTFDGVRQTGTMLDDLSPVTTAALYSRLPLSVRSVNDTWRGMVTRLGIDDEPLNLGVTAFEASSKHLVRPGFIYYSPTHDELSFVYGLAGSTLRDGVPERLTPVIALDGDWSEVQTKASSHLLEGAKNVTITATDRDAHR